MVHRLTLSPYEAVFRHVPPDMNFSRISPEAISPLTNCRGKIAAYRMDPYFRQGFEGINLVEAQSVTLMVLKPEAVVGRRLGPALEFLENNGFEVLEARRIRLSPILARELWRYQLNTATQDRLDVIDVLLPSTDSLLLLLRDRTSQAGGIPAATRLSQLKGSSDPSLQQPHSLRSRLQAPTRLLNFVHAPDEPADVVRELALFEVATGHQLAKPWGDLEAIGNAELAQAVQDLEQGAVSHDLDRTNSWNRLFHCAHAPLQELARAYLAGEAPFGWGALNLARSGHSGDPQSEATLLWDVLSIATAEIDCNLPGLVPLLPSMGAAPRRTLT